MRRGPSRAILAAFAAVFLSPISASAQLPGNLPGDFCALFGCYPTISSLIGIVRPGGGVIIVGSGFGEITPKVFLLLVDFSGTFHNIPFNIEASGDTWIGADISKDISGFSDQTGLLEVVTAIDAVSSSPITFEARRVVIQLPAGATTVLSCDQGADTFNSCTFDALGSGQVPPVLVNAWGLHLNDFGFVTGADTYQFAVINNWLFIDSDLTQVAENSVTLSGFNPGGSTAFAQVNFSIGFWSDLNYVLNPVITGPWGVPAR